MITIIHVNQQMLARNRKDGGDRPVLIVRSGSEPPVYGREVRIDGPSKLVYRATSPLRCGARAWIETEAPVCVEDAMLYREAISADQATRDE